MEYLLKLIIQYFTYYKIEFIAKNDLSVKLSYMQIKNSKMVLNISSNDKF